jgi:LysR family transcriptional activator of nhaA
MLLPTEGAVLRRSLDQWFDAREIRPRVVAELQDSALMKVFGQEGAGVFCAPSVLDASVRRQHGVHVVGRTDEVVERFYAISIERRIRHPAVAAICDVARRELFGE